MRPSGRVSRAVTAAACYWLRALGQTQIFSTNVTGTRIVMEEAIRAGVERVVYTSSVATVALRPDGSPADESASASEKEAIGAYKRSKIAAERLVLAMVEAQGLPAVIVNPSAPIGPRDVRPTRREGSSWRRLRAGSQPLSTRG